MLVAAAEIVSKLGLRRETSIACGRVSDPPGIISGSESEPVDYYARASFGLGGHLWEYAHWGEVVSKLAQRNESCGGGSVTRPKKLIPEAHLRI